MGDLRSEVKGDIGDLRAEVKGQGSRLAGLVIGATALILTGLGIASTVIVTQLG
jgi:hypothetical protein